MLKYKILCVFLIVFALATTALVFIGKLKSGRLRDYNPAPLIFAAAFIISWGLSFWNKQQKNKV